MPVSEITGCKGNCGSLTQALRNKNAKWCGGSGGEKAESFGIGVIAEAVDPGFRQLPRGGSDSFARHFQTGPAEHQGSGAEPFC
ncbi:MAG: hypothetical protein RLZZ536_2769 [Planctomycetota bacterium]